jgi:hypothetical protein
LCWLINVSALTSSRSQPCSKSNTDAEIGREHAEAIKLDESRTLVELPTFEAEIEAMQRRNDFRAELRRSRDATNASPNTCPPLLLLAPGKPVPKRPAAKRKSKG